MKYNIGDVVLIRKDLKVGFMYGGFILESGMWKRAKDNAFCGRIIEDLGDSYQLDISVRPYFTDEMIEGLAYEAPYNPDKILDFLEEL